MRIARPSKPNLCLPQRKSDMSFLARKKAFGRKPISRIALVGNPNVGKSVIFNWLTGKYATVSNYPGTTVEIGQGNMKLGHQLQEVIDTPGINSLVPMSEEERVTRNILLQDGDLKVIQVSDAKNLSRSLIITQQLAEMEKPVVLVLNMADEAKERGISIDVQGLSAILGIPVHATVAVRRKGLENLEKSLADGRQPQISVNFGPEIEESIKEIEKLLPERQKGKRALALMLLAGDESLKEWLYSQLKEEKVQEIENIRRHLQEKNPEPLGFVINRKRMQVINQILQQVFAQEKRPRGNFIQICQSLTTHPFWGIPFLFLVLFLIYELVAKIGAGWGVDFIFNQVFGSLINPAATWIVKSLFPWKLMQDLLVGPFGLITMGLTYALAIVLPIISSFFLAFGLLEDSGYLPRLAIMLHRIFRAMGLSGKAVLPMVLGLGCDTMATLTTRILETKKERIIVTLLLALGVPCSAQIGVMVGMFAWLPTWGILTWAIVVGLSIILVGFLASKLLPGEKADFILEIPPLRIPKLANIFLKTLARVEWFLKEAVPLFLLGTFILFILDTLHLLQALQRAAEPVVVNFLNLPAKTTEAFIMGFLRRDYGAAGFFIMAKAGELDAIQMVVSLITITLFVPCLANFFMIIKERGWKQALAMALFIFPFAILVGGGVNFLIRFGE